MNQQQPPLFGAGPEIDEILGWLGRHRRDLPVWILMIVAAWGAFLSYYQVGSDEVGVLTRFGRFTKLAESGLHFKIPWVEQVTFVTAKRQHKMEFGFRTVSAGVRSEFRRDAGTSLESLMLTGDLNVAVVEWIVQYQITDPYKYLFKVRNVEETLHAMSEAVMRSVVGDRSVTEVLTKGREEILEQARRQLGDLVKRYDLGITINRMELKDSAPPDQVKPSFNEVNQAEQERDRLQNQAWADYNKAIFKARGQAKQRIQQAQGYAIARVNHADGDVALFRSIEKEYTAAPEVTRTRLYLETIAAILPKVGHKVFIDADAKSLLPLLMPMQAGAAAGQGVQP